MSLVSVMRLLGHHDVRMTPRYAAITQQTVVKEYNDALRELETKYVVPEDADDDDPIEKLSDVMRSLKKRAADEPENRAQARALIKRLERLREQLRRMLA